MATRPCMLARVGRVGDVGLEGLEGVVRVEGCLVAYRA